jgi:predicted kinase
MARAKVAAIRFNQLSGPDLRLPEAQECKRYLRLALSYTRLQRPALLITHGLSGSGKSTLSGPLAVEMGGIRIRSDRERQRLFGRGKLNGEAVLIEQGAYSDAASRHVYDKLAELAGYVLASGYLAIIDATFLKRQQRDLFMQLAKSLGVPFRILFFRADADVLRQRIRRRMREGQDISEADICVLEHQLSGYTGLDADEQAYTVDIDTESVCEPEPIVALAPTIALTILREIWSRAH